MLWLRDLAVLTSGDYERYFEIEGKRYHHILDVRTGYPATGCSQVTVVMPDLGQNYLPSIALFLLGPEEGLRLIEAHPEMAVLIVTPEGRTVASPKAPLPAQLEWPRSWAEPLSSTRPSASA